MLTWNVYVENVNEKTIETRNIFANKKFVEVCKKSWKKNSGDRAAFEKDVRSELRYWYWSKCEWEIVLTSWPPREDFHAEKIDVFDQIMLNWNAFMEYLINHIKEL